MDITTLSNNENNGSLVCKTCHKTYRRRDLLMRHRRRCKGLTQSGNRRTACDACVEAKAKCCHSQPTCSRCAKRKSKCVYSAVSTQKRLQLDRMEENPSVRNCTLQASLPAESVSSAAEFQDWNFALSPSLLETLDLNIADFESMSPVPYMGPLIDSSHLSPMAQDNALLTALTQSSNNGTRYPTEAPTSSIAFTLARIIGDYASLVVKGSCFAPFIHLPKVRMLEPDLASFPFTSMAICSSTGMNLSTDKRFFRQVIDAARHRVIGNFPSYECMQQWDAIHAVLIYECLELKEWIGTEPEAWSLAIPAKNLEMVFLVKMTKAYIKPYLKIRSLDPRDFSDPKETPCSPITTTWGRWRTTETTRRTVFIVNMANFLCNYDPGTRKTSSYYEAVNDDLILSMPLPCNQTAWLAYEEDGCRLAMQKDRAWADYSQADLDHSVIEALSREPCLNAILSKYSKEDIRAAIGQRVGISDSDELRRLIILCATEQYL